MPHAGGLRKLHLCRPAQPPTTPSGTLPKNDGYDCSIERPTLIEKEKRSPVPCALHADNTKSSDLQLMRGVNAAICKPSPKNQTANHSSQEKGVVVCACACVCVRGGDSTAIHIPPQKKKKEKKILAQETHLSTRPPVAASRQGPAIKW